MNKSLIVAKREYTKVIRKPSFWISTLFFPIFIIAISFISGYSSMQLEEKLKTEAENANKVLIVDNSGYIKDEIYSSKFQKALNIGKGIEDVKNNQADALIVYPADIANDNNIQIYSQDKGLLFNETYNSIATDLLKQSILSNLNDAEKIKAYNSTFNFNVTTYKNGEETKFSLSNLIVPAISLVIYFILTTFAVSYLLLSVSEEKENRVMEIVLSTISSRNLILGKIVGLIGIIFTQVLLLIVLSIIGLLITSSIMGNGQSTSIQSIGGLLGSLSISPLELIGQIVLGIIFTFTGFFILACTMVGVGAAAPTYKEAQSLSSIFVMVSIFPIYFITMLISDPNGTLAQIFSYIPFTSSFVLLFRNALGALSLLEIVIGIVLLVIYCILGVVIAFKLFEYGALEYNRRISFKEFLRSFKR